MAIFMLLSSVQKHAQKGLNIMLFFKKIVLNSIIYDGLVKSHEASFIET